MLVISDTSPITNLMQIGLISLLKEVYGQVIIPKSVYEELCQIESQKLQLDNQTWIFVESAKNYEFVETLMVHLDRGEAESIALSVEINPDFLIIDERKGRQIAAEYGIKITGLLGTLLKAKSLGLIPSIKTILEGLRSEALFYIYISDFGF